MNALPKTKASKPKSGKSKANQYNQAAVRARLPLTKPVNDPLIRQLLELLPTILPQHFSAEELAEALGVSYSTLRQRFRAATGVSLWGYVKWLRMETARQLLEREPLSVRRVLAQVGVRDVDHFRREFRAAYRLSPRAYRARWGQSVLAR